MKILIVLLCFALLIIIAWYIFFFICNKKNELAESKIIKIIPMINKYHSVNNKYPATLDVLEGYPEIKKEKTLFFFSNPTIEYKKNSEGYELSFHGSPFGPFLVYDSKQDKWFNEE